MLYAFMSRLQAIFFYMFVQKSKIVNAVSLRCNTARESKVAGEETADQSVVTAQLCLSGSDQFLGAAFAKSA